MLKLIAISALALATPAALMAQMAADQTPGSGMGTNAYASPNSPAGDEASGASATKHGMRSHRATSSKHRTMRSHPTHTKSSDVAGTPDTSTTMTDSPH